MVPTKRPLAVVILAAGTFDPIKERPNRSLLSLLFRLAQWLLKKVFLLFGTDVLDRGPMDPPVQRMSDVAVAERRICQRIVDACRASTRLAVAPIALVVRNKQDSDLCDGVDMVVEGGSSLGSSLRNGIGALPPGHDVLAVCGDLALLTPEALDDFVDEAAGTRTEICVGFVEYDYVLQQYPALPKTAARLYDGTAYRRFCASGTVLLDPAKTENVAEVLDVFSGARKSVLGIAGLLGPVDPLLYLAGRYSIERAKAKFAELFDATVGAVESIHASLCVDVDDKATYDYVQRLLSPQPVAARQDLPDDEPTDAGEDVISPAHLVND